MSSHICADIGDVVMLHEYLFERHFSAVIGHIKLDVFAPIRSWSFPRAICFDLLRCWKQRVLTRDGHHADQLVRRSFSFLPISTSQLTDCPSSDRNVY